MKEIKIESTLYVFESLNEVPKDTNILCQLSIVLILINIISNGIQTALQSIGEIKLYQVIVGSLICN